MAQPLVGIGGRNSLGADPLVGLTMVAFLICCPGPVFIRVLTASVREWPVEGR